MKGEKRGGREGTEERCERRNGRAKRLGKRGGGKKKTKEEERIIIRKRRERKDFSER